METGRRKKMRIAVARDPAFNFIYRENLDRLAESGNLTFFSPVYGSDLPDADLVYLPGGYPELFARQLHRRKRMMQQLRDYAESGGKVFAECGGMMFLTRSLTARKGGTAYQMTGLLPVDCTMENARLHLGYRRMDYQGISLRGHEFHYSSIAEPDTLPSVTPLYNVKGTEVSTQL
jgi:cobyrinic acid a,c-diamide synthase